MKGSTTPLTDSPANGAVELLYESSTTRVFRDAPAAASVVCKEPLGADAAQRLRHEENMLARLDGLAGVAQLAAGSHPDGMLVLQDSHGGTLAQLLRAGPMQHNALLNMATQLTRSVAAVHRAGVIHRDINPSNILVSESSEPVLIDFDLAAPADQLALLGHQDGIVGTLGYLAPEQTGRTGHPVDQRSDLYALGATLYEMATAQPPFEGADTLQLIHDHLVHEPLAPVLRNVGLPKTLSDILLRLLAKAPEQRYQSAEGLLHDLQRLKEELPAGGDGGFALGERDFPARLLPPQQLIGRDAELGMLRAALADALHTPRRLLLVEGPAGVGKSALVNELRQLVAQAGGWFVHGKFDQYQKDRATLGALSQALQMLGRLLLAQPRDDLAAQRQRILDSLGRNTGMMTRLLPEFAMLLGPQPDVLEIDPRQAELQLHEATVALLGAIASPERPVVVVLDDLQWTGVLSLRTLERLRGEPTLRGLLIVGAYRAGEGNAGDALSPMLAQWRQQPQAPTEIALANLTPDGMGELIGHMLRLARPAANELARAIGALTNGNPFDTVELINALRKDGVLSLGPQGWQWDEKAIRHFVGRGNVVDLLAARIGRLPPPARELLEYMSCLGNTVECKLLGVATGLGEAELQQLLRAPLEDGLLQAGGSERQQSVHFRHDRVQQAVLAAMDDAQRGQRQLAMARRLASGFGFDDIAAQQYLACAPLLGDAAEQRRAAHLFHGLAQKLASMATYALAERYLASAGALLAALDDATDTALRGAIDARRHAALYSLGRLDDADECYLAIKARTADMLDQVEPACLQMRSLDMRGRSEDAMQLGLGMLAQLGLHVPADYAASDTGQRLDALGDWVRQDRLLDHRTRPQIQDLRLLAIAKLLGRTVRSAFVRFDTRAIVWLLLESQRLWAEHGPCPELVANLGRMSGMLISQRQDYRGAHSIASHVLSVGEALQYDLQAAEASFICATYTNHWFEPLEEGFPNLARAYERVRAGGDASFACYVHLVLFTVLVEIAPTIDVTLSELDDGISLCRRTGNVHAAALHTSLRQTLRALGGLTRPSGSFDDAQYDEQSFLQRMGKLPFVENSCAVCIAMHALIMGETGELARTADRGMATLDNLAGYYMTAYAHFFVAMARALEVQSDPSGPQRTERLAELESCRAWLDARAADQPYNYLHLLRLVEAEQAWAMGDLWKAATSFNTAVNEAES
ncbi:MAG: AAA family ATPase, partial [Burkholderiaceae bacterium]|nr:AAA family ATPase [Burkholderiaceae bacterium]